VKKNILITGANGLVGSSLIRYLSNKNFEITGTFNKNKKNLIKKKNIKYIQCNITNRKALKELFKKKRFDIVINSAAILKSKENNFSSSIEMFDDNVKIQKNLLRQSVNSNVGQFIFLSSISIYEGIKKNEKFHEDQNYQLKSIYALSKVTCENFLENTANSSNLKGISLRLAGVHGIGKKSGVIYNMFNQAHKGGTIQVNEPNSVFRLTFLEDINKAIDLIIKRKMLNKYKVYNLAGEEIYNLKKLGKVIIKLCKKGKLKLLKNSKIRYQVLNINKFKKDYKYKPTALLKKLKNYNEHYKNTNNLDFNN